MDYKKIKLEMTGLAPLIMHNGQMANPLNNVSREIKKVSGKRKKTDDDFMLMSKLEMLGGVYVSEEPVFEVSGYNIKLTSAGRLAIPSDNWESCIIESAKRLRLGKQAKAGIIVTTDTLLLDAPSVQEMLDDMNKWAFIKRVKVQQAAIMRTRPILKQWSTKLEVSYLPDLFNLEQVLEIVDQAGKVVGVGDYRPKYGRFARTV